MVDSLFHKEIGICYGVILCLTLLGLVTDKIPIQLSITLHSMLIISIGSYKSLECMMRQIKSVFIDKKGGTDMIEQMSWNDAMQFPIMAGVTLCGLYFAMEFFGKDVVNYFLLTYIAIGGITGIRSIIDAIVPGAFESYDKDNIIDINVKLIGLELQMTAFDFICLFFSGV